MFVFLTPPARHALLLLLVVGSSSTAHAQNGEKRPAAPAASAPPAAPPTAPPASIALRLDGLVATPRTLSAADLAALPAREQATTDKQGQKHVYQGVALSDVLALAGAPAGKAIHGPVLAQALLATAADGYRVVLALPETDPSFAAQPVLLALRRDGQPLSAQDGPLQLILPLEKRPARWVRQLTGLRVVEVK